MDIVEFVKSFPLQNFTKGEVLLSADEQTDSVLLIKEGAIKVSSIDRDGRDRLLWLAGRYDIVPTEKIFIATATTQYFYTAFSDGAAYIVNKKDLLAIATDNINVMSQIAHGLSEHHDNLLDRLNSIEQPDLQTKIIYMIHSICEKFSSASTVKLHEVGVNLTHQDIADMVDATREAVSLELKLLKDAGYIDYSRKSFIVYMSKLSQKVAAST